MLHIRKKILVGALCASMVLSASQSVAWSESNSMTAEAGSAEAGSEESAADTAEAETSTAEASTSEAEPVEDEKQPIQEDDVLAECELAASNENFELLVNTKTGLFAFRTKDGDHIWWSNPYNADDDPVANNSKKEDLKSSLVINAVKVTDIDNGAFLERQRKCDR